MQDTTLTMSSEEIADEIRKEGREKNIPEYAAMIERYADEIGQAYLQQLRKQVEKDIPRDDYERFDEGIIFAYKKVLNLIDQQLNK